MGDPTHLRRLRAGRCRVAHKDGLLQGAWRLLVGADPYRRPEPLDAEDALAIRGHRSPIRIGSYSTGSPARSRHPQLRIGVPGGSARRKNSTRLRLGLTTTGSRAASSSGRSAEESEYAISMPV